MALPPSPNEIRQVLLQAIESIRPSRPDDPSQQLNTLFSIVREKLTGNLGVEVQQEVLTQLQTLVHTGHISWGLNLDNPNPPFFHLTAVGKRTVRSQSRDPANPAGYLAHLAAKASLNPIADSYLREGLASFAAGLHKSAAVMVGAASESLILELRDTTVARLSSLSRSSPKQLTDWRVKTVLDALHSLLNDKKASLPHPLREEFEAYFLAFAQQIRAGRNDAGHPSSIDPVTDDGVHASFLVFPELARLAAELRAWISTSLP